MGFDLAQVLSDEKHYGPFVCGICRHLVDLETAVVTECCPSRPYCRDCVVGTAWAPKQQTESSSNNNNTENGGNNAHDDAKSGRKCPCPTCAVDLTTTSHAGRNDTVGTSALLAPLHVAQPLAFHLLTNVQVACVDRTDRIHCEWVGDYADFVEHAVSRHDPECAARSFVVVSPSAAAATADAIDRIQQQHQLRLQQGANGVVGVRPTMKGLRSISMPSVVKTDNRGQRDGRGRCATEDGAEYYFDSDYPNSPTRSGNSPLQPQRLPSTPGPFRKSASLRDLGGPRSQQQQRLSKQQPPVRIVDEIRLSSPPPANSSIASPPESAQQKDEPPHLVQRTFSEDGSFCGHNIKFSGKNNNNATANTRSLKRRPKPAASSSEDVDLEMSYSQALDWNTSISSFGKANNSYPEPSPMETLNEDEPKNDFSLEFELDGSDSNLVEKTKKTKEKAEKLKKQANAKFNKGDFSAARSLYTEGITVMSAIDAVSADDCDLLSNMHSNRAVTFFREKKFEECIDDCDKAIGYDPLYDKSWIRKWRALMALGDVEAAYTCLEVASETVPDSKRIMEEFDKCSGDKRLLADAQSELEKGEFQKARDMLKPYSRNSDNLGLLLLAARADAGLGHTESALEKVNKALRFNPTHIECLEVRGYTLFLTGETEKGAHLLREAYDQNRENKAVRLELLRCQKTHSASSKGRSCVKRGRYVEAAEHFTSAIKESGRVPLQAPLFGQLRTERAEAFLLCKKYMEALRDCDEVLKAQQENATAWSVRAEILIALGQADEAKGELEKIRGSWGGDNPTIDEAYRRVDFELRVLKEDAELMDFVEDLKSGNIDKLPFDIIERKSPPRKSYRRGKSSGADHDDNNDRERRVRKNSKDRPSTSEGHNRRSGDRRRSKSRPRGDRRHASNNSSSAEQHENGDRADQQHQQRPQTDDLSKENKKRPSLERQGLSERVLDTADGRQGHRSRSAKRS